MNGMYQQIMKLKNLNFETEGSFSRWKFPQTNCYNVIAFGQTITDAVCVTICHSVRWLLSHHASTLWTYPLLCKTFILKTTVISTACMCVCVWQKHTGQVTAVCHLFWLLLSDTHVFLSYSVDAAHRWCVMLHTLLFWQTGNDTPTCANNVSISSEYKRAIFDQTREGHCSCSRFLLWMIWNRESLSRCDRSMPCNVVLFTAARERFSRIQSDYCCHYVSDGGKTKDSDKPRQRKLLLRVQRTQ